MVLVGCREGFALISCDLQRAALVDLALEGYTHDLLSPSIFALAGLNKQLAELEKKAQQKAFE